MTYLAIALLVVGAICLMTEIFIPGFGFFGITGIVCLIISSIITVLFVQFGAFIVVGEIFVLVFAVFAAVKYIKNHQLQGRLILDETLDNDKNEIGDIDYFLGKEGITKTSLRPFGDVDFNGVVVGVCSEGDYISPHQKVKVVKISDSKIYVKKTDTN